MIYCEQSISRDSERKGGCFVNEYIQALPGILFWVGLFVVLRVTRKKREEAREYVSVYAEKSDEKDEKDEKGGTEDGKDN